MNLGISSDAAKLVDSMQINSGLFVALEQHVLLEKQGMRCNVCFHSVAFHLVQNELNLVSCFGCGSASSLLGLQEGDVKS